MRNLPPEEDLVNRFLDPLFEAITRRWEARDRAELSRLQAAAALTEPAAAPRPRDGVLRPVRREASRQRLQGARSEELVQGMGKQARVTQACRKLKQEPGESEH